MEENQKTNWREKVKPEWLYINHEAVARGLVKKDANVEDVEDRFLCIKLAGLRQLALDRGYCTVDYEIVAASMDYVAMKCSIGWVETETEEGCLFSSTADAHINNTKDFCQNFLCAIAENRAFSRCVRNYLNIEIVSDAELGDTKKKGNEIIDSTEVLQELDIHDKLKEVMVAKGLSFEKMKEKLTAENFEGIESINRVEDFSSADVLALIKRVKAIKKNA